MYRALQDFVDGDGHGTHCAGSAVGSFNNGVCSSMACMLLRLPDCSAAPSKPEEPMECAC